MKNRILRNVLLIAYMVILFIPINYLMVAIHEFGHAAGAYLTGGYFTYIQLFPSLTTGGLTYCGGGVVEWAWAGGILLASSIGLLASYHKGLWYVALIFSVRSITGFTSWMVTGGWCDMQALWQLHTPLAILFLALPIMMSLATIYNLFARYHPIFTDRERTINF